MEQNSSKNLDILISKANEFELRTLIRDWCKKNNDFKEFLISKLAPSLENEDFYQRLSDVIAGSVNEHQIRRYDYEITINWRNVNVIISEWEKEVETLTTPKLLELINAILDTVCINISEEDFQADDWYGNDYSGDIVQIMDELSYFNELLVLREDINSEDLESIIKKTESLRQNDISGSYVGSPYGYMEKLCLLRMKTGTVTLEIYDEIISRNYNGKGPWICRKVEFMRANGNYEDPMIILKENLTFHEVAIKLFQELLMENRLEEALILLDKMIFLKKEETQMQSQREYCGNLWNGPNWLEVKQKFLDQHGTLEARIENLKKLFNSNTSEKKEYYLKLKELIPTEEWKSFHLILLKELTGIEAAPFYLIENELDNLFRLIEKDFNKYPSNYYHLLEYAENLKPNYNEEIKVMLEKAFIEYASQKFIPGRQLKGSYYERFAENLRKMKELGFEETVNSLVDYFLNKYKQRKNLLAELRKI